MHLFFKLIRSEKFQLIHLIISRLECKYSTYIIIGMPDAFKSGENISSNHSHQHTAHCNNWICRTEQNFFGLFRVEQLERRLDQADRVVESLYYKLNPIFHLFFLVET